MGQFVVILAAAGRSTRFGDPKQKKIYAELEGRAVWLRALDPFLTHGEVEQIIVAIAPEDRELFDRRYHDKAAFLNLDVIDGGAERSDTVARALERVRPVCQFVAIHDAARPCLTENMVSAVFSAARDHGAALLATPVSDTIKRTGDDRFTTETVPRRNLYLAQTPQVFRRDWLEAAYARRAQADADVTDDTQLVEALGHRCVIVPGSPLNLKLTTQEDLKLATAILRVQSSSPRETSGHPFADEAALWADLPNLKASDLFDS
jgi:2-C-methyl-D-erythritol 4-phosphate cytidylyltransferase